MWLKVCYNNAFSETRIGSFMQQEDLNAIMKYPWEVVTVPSAVWNKCPRCGEGYCGNGVDLCVECKAKEA